jgi:hypothetical protein
MSANVRRVDLSEGVVILEDGEHVEITQRITPHGEPDIDDNVCAVVAGPTKDGSWISTTVTAADRL